MKNIGKIDKIIRVILGIVVMSLYFILEGNLKYIGCLGILPIATVLTGSCPLYYLFKINTCSSKEK